MSSDEPIGIVGVGDRLRTEIQSGDFDRFVIFTYGITPGYLEWFDQSDLVAICGPNETVEAVRTTPETPLVSTFNRETHAKMYLLYNDTRMVAYVGSFNFTRTGLYESVEWGARYEGTLVGMPPDPEALLNGETDPEISQSPIIEQLLTIVGASMDASDTDRADSWVANTELGEGVVHTLRSNTLQTALSDTLRDATPPIEITYFSPFVTYDGVREFASYLPPDIDESEVDFTVYTKRLGRIGDTEDLLSPELIERLDDRFRSFRLRARASGDQGNELPDGREIRGGMAHFKTILLGDQCGADAQPLGVLLTSANLSNRAWDRRSTGFEIGVAITESQRAEQLYHFFADELSQCYVDPSKRALSSVGTSTPTRSWGTDEWLDERLRNRLAIESDAVEIAWDDSLPALTELEARVFHRDLDTGVRTEHRASFTPMADGYRAAVPSVTAEANQIIDFVRVIARSRHSPPERIYSTREVRELRADLGIEDDPEILPEEWHEFEELIWNGSIRKTVSEAAFSDIGTIQSVRLRSSHEEPHPYHVTYEPDSQPHINSLIQETTLTTRDVRSLGTVVSLTVETNPNVSLVAENSQVEEARETH